MIAEFGKEYHWKDIYFLNCPFCNTKMEVGDLDWLDLLVFCNNKHLNLYFELTANNNYNLFEASVKLYWNKTIQFNFYKDSSLLFDNNQRYELKLKWPQNNLENLLNIYKKYSIFF